MTLTIDATDRDLIERGDRIGAALVRGLLAHFDEAEARATALESALRALLRCEYEANGMGLYDCIDNDGVPYQSADLDKQIKNAEALLTKQMEVGGAKPS